MAGGIRFASLTAGFDHTCGLTNDGKAYCWGSDGEEQLGVDAATAQCVQGLWPNGMPIIVSCSPVPVPVAGGLTFASLTAGENYTCGLTSGGVAYCWGWIYPNAPWSMTGDLAFATLGAGAYHICGVTRAGTAYCWGDNYEGSLGDGSTTNHDNTPTPVAGGLTFASVTAGFDHTCGLTNEGKAYCWGSNGFGQLGTDATIGDCGNGPGADPCSTRPVPVAGGLAFASLSAGWLYTCGVTSTGAAYCWGKAGALGTDVALGECPMGSLLSPCSRAPVPVAGGLTFASVTTGAGHTCGVTTAGAAYCWGSNWAGELGDGSLSDRATPVRVVGF